MLAISIEYGGAVTYSWCCEDTVIVRDVCKTDMCHLPLVHWCDLEPWAQPFAMAALALVSVPWPRVQGKKEAMPAACFTEHQRSLLWMSDGGYWDHLQNSSLPHC